MSREIESRGVDRTCQISCRRDSQSRSGRGVPMASGRAETVADALLQLVIEGTFPPGTTLPSEAELAERFEVSRLTVREAIRSLASTNVIRVQQGRSSVITPAEAWSPLDPRLLQARGHA